MRSAKWLPNDTAGLWVEAEGVGQPLKMEEGEQDYVLCAVSVVVQLSLLVTPSTHLLFSIHQCNMPST